MSPSPPALLSHHLDVHLVAAELEDLPDLTDGELQQVVAVDPDDLVAGPEPAVSEDDAVGINVSDEKSVGAGAASDDHAQVLLTSLIDGHFLDKTL